MVVRAGVDVVAAPGLGAVATVVGPGATPVASGVDVVDDPAAGSSDVDVVARGPVRLVATWEECDHGWFTSNRTTANVSAAPANGAARSAARRVRSPTTPSF